MEFTCYNALASGEIETWKGKIVEYKVNDNILEMYIDSRSSLHIIIGKSKLGNFACVPNFEIGCYLSEFSDIFWNKEKLISLLGIVDGITVASAIKYIDNKLL